MLAHIIKKPGGLLNKTNCEIQDMMQEINKKILSKNYENAFCNFRARIEKMVEIGYRVQPITQEDRDFLKNAKLALSPLEQDFYSTIREDGTLPKRNSTDEDKAGSKKRKKWDKTTD